MTRLALVLALCVAAVRASGAVSPLLDSPELGRLAATRIESPSIDPAFLGEIAKVAEEKLRVPGAKQAGMGPVSAASLKLPGNKAVALVFGYVKGRSGGKNRRWFTAFTSRGKTLPPIEVPADGSGDMAAFQSVEPAGVFWVLLSPRVGGRLLHFDVVNELEVKPILAGNFDYSISATNYLTYASGNGQELFLLRVSDRYPNAVPGVMAFNPSILQVSDLTVNALLGNFEAIRKSLTRVRPVVYVTTK